MKEYIHNLETGKIELHFEKSEYLALSDELKKELKSAFLFSKFLSAWVSRSTKNHWAAIRVAEKLGFTEEIRKGERLSYSEELERKTEKAEARAERYTDYARNAIKKGGDLQKEFNTHRGDIAFLTQPNINSSAGRAFTNRRNAIVARYEKGFEEYRKSEYYRERAAIARSTANMAQLRNKVYLHNRIEECNKNIRAITKDVDKFNIVLEYKETGKPIKGLVQYYELEFYESKSIEEIQERVKLKLESLEYEIDKLAFLQNALDDLGGVQYSRENIKPGYLVKIRRRWNLVIKANPKTVEVKTEFGSYLNYPYAEIQELKGPENWKEPESGKKSLVDNPFNVGDVLVAHNFSGQIYRAFQILKTTDKFVTMREIKVDNTTPVKDHFIGNLQLRRGITKNWRGEIGVNYNDECLSKYGVA